MFNLEGGQEIRATFPRGSTKGVPDLMRNVWKDGHQTKVSPHPSSVDKYLMKRFRICSVAAIAMAAVPWELSKLSQS